jgi:hypothetical protein
MRYDDFIYFMLSEEDKGTPASLRYWFECVDLDADGAVTPRDMKHFYDTQVGLKCTVGNLVASQARFLFICALSFCLSAPLSPAVSAVSPPLFISAFSLR